MPQIAQKNRRPLVPYRLTAMRLWEKILDVQRQAKEGCGRTAIATACLSVGAYLPTNLRGAPRIMPPSS